MSIKKYVVLGFTAVLLIVGLTCLGSIFETVEKGTYQTKQAAVSGVMSAKMTPGLWMQNFGDIDVWPIGETFFFTQDNDTAGDSDIDTSMEVRFNDGSMCKISGTLRIIMPTTESDAIALITERGHKTYNDVQEKLIKPTVRNVLRSTANLMSARESYSEKRPDFISYARDQIENGVYKTKEEVQQVDDLVTGEKTWRKIKVIRTTDAGDPLYEDNPMEGTGIVLKNFEIKTFIYEKKVQAQIAKQQEARMAVETAKAKAEEARQDELKAVAEGKKNVAIAKYEQEEEKIRAVVQAEKEKETAVIAAQKLVAVAEQGKLEAEQKKLAAAEYKREQQLRGEGDAAYKKAVILADGALEQKLKAYVEVNGLYADAIRNYQGNWVPTTVMGGGAESGENGAQALINLLTAKTAKDLNLDMSIQK